VKQQKVISLIRIDSQAIAAQLSRVIFDGPLWLCPDFNPDLVPLVFQPSTSLAVDVRNSGWTGTIYGLEGQFIGYKDNWAFFRTV